MQLRLLGVLKLPWRGLGQSPPSIAESFVENNFCDVHEKTIDLPYGTSHLPRYNSFKDRFIISVFIVTCHIEIYYRTTSAGD